MCWRLLALLAPLSLVASGAVNNGIADETKQSALAPLVRVLAASDDVAVQRDVLTGMFEALQGRQAVVAPAGWAAVYRKVATSPDQDVRQKGLVLSVLFDDAGALADLRAAIADPHAEAGWRQFSLQTLVEKRPADLSSVLKSALDDPALRGSALRGLAACNDPATPDTILSRYHQLTEAERADAVATLTSRPAYAMALLDAIERGRVPRRDLSSFTARQLLAMKDAKLSDRLTAVWGTVRAPSKEKAALLARYKAVATPAALHDADRVHGRQLFAKMCANCHTLFDAGARVGPELTGSQRANPEYVLSKVLDPNAVVTRDYRVTLLVTKSGRTITGIVKEENDKVLTLQTATELVRFPTTDIEERTELPQSMMPEGLLNDRSDAEIRDLLAYLAGNGQVPLPK
jgi:putative heme-binding domain-containing protein